MTGNKMLGKTGLIVCSNPNKIGKILSTVKNNVKNTLYIQLLSALGEPLGSFYPNVFNTWPKFSQTVFGIYSQAATHCKDLDVRVLLSGLKYNISTIQTHYPVDLIIFDKPYSKPDIDNFISKRISNFSKNGNILTVDAGELEPAKLTGTDNDQVFKHTVLGGTFDRLHLAHKVLLSEAILRAKETITVGVTEENMIKTKTLWELIQPIDIRIENVVNFLKDVCPELQYNVVPISDPFGPAITDPTMELIVVSAETLRGGLKINEIRKEKNLPELVVKPIELVDEPNPNPVEESKISSSTQRMRLLGTLLNPIQLKNIPKSPYIIGLTGGIASGKSNVANELSELGAEIINCDIVAHQVYKRGKPCYEQLIEHFGEKIVGTDGEIDRKVLGPIVFQDAKQLEALNSIVWPGIEEEVKEIIRKSDKKIIVIEAAVLLMAGWERICHEVWTTVVPRTEAIERLKNRNNLTEEQANNRIDSQPCNSKYVQSSNVVFCSLWTKEYTKQQVTRAWQLLEQRIKHL